MITALKIIGLIVAWVAGVFAMGILGVFDFFGGS